MAKPRRIPKLCRRSDDRRLYVTDPDTRRQVPLKDEADYERWRAEFVARQGRGRPLPQRATVGELLESYLTYAGSYYIKRGKPTSYRRMVDMGVRAVRDCWGDRRDASAVQGADVEALQEHLIGLDYARSTVNATVQIVRRCWKWGVAKGGVAPEALTRISAVPGLKRGRSRARESPRVRVVEQAHVEATIAAARRPLPDMIRLQLLLGCRPGELCVLRPRDLDRSGTVWVYTVDPEYDKTEHRRAEGAARRVYVGPRAQAILLPLLENAGDAEAPLFRGRGGSPLTRNAYGRRVALAAERAGVPHWSPNRLRHNRATEIRRGAYGIEGAAAVLGHQDPDTTLIYAEKDAELARRIAEETG